MKLYIVLPEISLLKMLYQHLRSTYDLENWDAYSRFSFESNTEDVHRGTNKNPRKRMKMEEDDEGSQSEIKSAREQKGKGKRCQSIATSRQPNYRKAEALDRKRRTS
jgi:hypothetical protein